MEGSVSVVKLSNSKPQDQLTLGRLTDGVAQAPSAGSESALRIVSMKIGDRVYILTHSLGKIIYCKLIPGLFHEIVCFHWYQSSLEATPSLFSTLSA